MDTTHNLLIKFCLISYVAGAISDANGSETGLVGTTLNRTELPCKEVSLNDTNRNSQSYSIRDALSHGAVRRDSAGRLTHLEQRVAIQAEREVGITLMNKESEPASKIRYTILIGVESNRDTYLQKYINGHYSATQHNLTPDILSATEYRAFYVRIDNGTLEFGKEGGPPLISYNDAGLGSFKYIQFYYGALWSTGAKIRFDCSAPVEH